MCLLIFYWSGRRDMFCFLFFLLVWFCFFGSSSMMDRYWLVVFDFTIEAAMFYAVFLFIITICLLNLALSDSQAKLCEWIRSQLNNEICWLDSSNCFVRLFFCSRENVSSANVSLLSHWREFEAHLRLLIHKQTFHHRCHVFKWGMNAWCFRTESKTATYLMQKTNVFTF